MSEFTLIWENCSSSAFQEKSQRCHMLSIKCRKGARNRQEMKFAHLNGRLSSMEMTIEQSGNGVTLKIAEPVVNFQFEWLICKFRNFQCNFTANSNWWKRTAVKIWIFIHLKMAIFTIWAIKSRQFIQFWRQFHLATPFMNSKNQETARKWRRFNRFK